MDTSNSKSTRVIVPRSGYYIISPETLSYEFVVVFLFVCRSVFGYVFEFVFIFGFVFALGNYVYEGRLEYPMIGLDNAVIRIGAVHIICPDGGITIPCHSHVHTYHILCFCVSCIFQYF